MRMPLTILTVALVVVSSVAGYPPNPAPTPIADALGWYSVWFMSDRNAPGRRTCRGEFRAGLYSFRCDPLAVVVSATVEDSGRCSIGNMRPSVEQDDGLRVNTLPHLVPQGKANVPRPGECGELPTTEGKFEFTVTSRLRDIDGRLTEAARAAAIAFMIRARDRRATLRLPKVRTGDPFFHVYCEYDGVLDAVMEFVIRNGQVDDFPHWTYDRPHRNIPPGATRRLGEPGLWSGISRPEERGGSPR